MAEHHGHTHDHEDYPAFFEYKELVLSLEHDPEITPAHLTDWLEKTAGSLNLSAPLSLKRPTNQENFQPVTPLGRSERGTNLSLLYVAFDGGNTDPSAALKPEQRLEADQQVLQVVDQINARRRELSNDWDGKPIIIRAASPNWLFGAAPHQLVDGGPGGRPVDTGKIPNPDDYKFNCPLGEQVLMAYVKSQGTGDTRSVAVAILDAVPPAHLLDHVCDNIAEADNPLLHRTMKKLNVVRRGTLGITLPVEPSTTPPAPDAAYTSHSADYEISDHGLFVAGTVNILEPEADLLLLEVLNHYGIGTVETIAKGIEQIWKHLDPIPQTLIVNLSLCISFQNICVLSKHYDWRALEVGGKPYFDLLLQPLKDAINSLYAGAEQAAATNARIKEKIEVRIVAAAGNDGRVGDVMPPFARYPAAFENVLGVGALYEHVNRTDYSNLTDDPTKDGLMVFGGEIDPGDPSMSSATGGMLGLYIGNFPTDSTPPASNPSKYGWGRWSGTSFATGLMSGLLAQAAHQNFPVAQGAGGDFDQVLAASVPSTPYGERYLESWQGP